MFSIEQITNQEKQKQLPEIHIRGDYGDFVPTDFKSDPKKYIEESGENIKSGEIKYHEDGSVREDPTAAKFLPNWQKENGETVRVVSKRVNLNKVRTRTELGGEATEDMLLEYKMMCLCKILNLPAANPIGYTKQANEGYIIMERVAGTTWTKKDFQKLYEHGFTEGSKEDVKNQIEFLMEGLKKRYEDFGIYRKWKHKDMVFDIDLESKQVLNITPVDWEGSHLDLVELSKSTSGYSEEIQKQIQDVVLLKA